MTDLSGILFGEARPSESVAQLPLGAVVREYIRLYAEGTTHTARAKQLDADKFLEFLKRRKRKNQIDDLLVADWDYSTTQMFVDESLRLGEAPATVARRLATLKHMGRIVAERLPGFINPAREVKPPRQQTIKPKSINHEEVECIKARIAQLKSHNGSFATVRNETLLKLLLDTGLRADEVRSLKKGQLDGDCEWIRQVRTKGRRFRDVYITESMRSDLHSYLRSREEELKRVFPTLSPTTDAKLPLFVSLHGAIAAEPKTFELSPKSIWRIIRNCSVRTKLHPHLLRHTYATDLLEDSKDIRLVAQALGHSDVRITMRYTERGNEEIALALERSRKGKNDE